MDSREIVQQLTLDEKLQLLTAKNAWETVPVDRLGIPSIFVADGPHGVRKEIKKSDGSRETIKSVCFPTSSAMSATWNPEMVQKVAECIAEECQAADVDVLLGPGINIKRTPVCGRNFEYFSEDPYLAGELAAAYINGVQSKGVGTSLKHFAVNNQEYDRQHISSEVDTRAMREIYLKPFEIAVKKARPWTMMCAYNRLNGSFCSEHKTLLDDILRKEWGFDGIVMSDWDAVWDRAKSLKASLELEMPFSEKSFENLKKAYQEGYITDDEIDTALERLLKFIFLAYSKRSQRVKAFDAQKHHQVAIEAAREAVTLLKNEENILPVCKSDTKRIAVIGEFADRPMIQGGGSSRVNAVQLDKPIDKIRELAGNDIEIDYVSGFSSYYHGVYNFGQVLQAAEHADKVIIFAANRDEVEREGYDRISIRLSPEIENGIVQISRVNPNTTVVVQAGSAIDMSSWIDSVKGVVFAWYTGQASGSAIADILFGVVNPSGKIAETFPMSLEDNPAYDTYPGNGLSSWYKEGIMVGYRYYDTYGKNVLFPFGHGLSYTRFQYSDLKITPEEANENDAVTVTLKVKNVGPVKGKEVVQLYVSDIISYALRPTKELKGFSKVDLSPGEEREVKFTLDRNAFAYYSTAVNDWHVESGEFRILVGSSSRDIRLSGKVNIKG